jgi:iron ABC superfamily ATP binding cassette transporter, binding protein
MFAGKNISLFRNRPYFSKKEKEILLDRWIKEVRFYEE